MGRAKNGSSLTIQLEVAGRYQRAHGHWHIPAFHSRDFVTQEFRLGNTLILDRPDIDFFPSCCPFRLAEYFTHGRR